MGMLDDFTDYKSEDPEPAESTPWYSGAVNFFKDIGTSAITDFSAEAKSRIQTEITKNLSGVKEKANPYDVGRLQYETDQTNRSGLMPGFSIPVPSLPGRPDTVSMASFIPEGVGKYLLFGGLGIAGLILLKRFL